MWAEIQLEKFVAGLFPSFFASPQNGPLYGKLISVNQMFKSKAISLSS
jgi:hypothetical protein